MLFSTIFHCTLLATTFSEPNAADAWTELAEQMNGIEIPYGEPSEWTVEEQAQYEQLAPLIKRVREIGKMSNCEWNLDRSQGLEMIIPNISNIMQAARLTSYSIRDDEKTGNYESALSGAESLLGISKQLEDQHTIISSLVSYSVFSIDKNIVSVFDKTKSINQLESFQQTLGTLDSFDPFGIREGLYYEKEIIAESFRTKSVEEIDLGGFVEELQLNNLDMDNEMDQYESMMDRAVEISLIQNKTHAIEAATELSEEVQSGQYGILSKALYPSLDALLEQAFRASDDLEEMKSTLQKRIDMLRSPNAATYFLEAANSYLSIDTKTRIYYLEQGDYSVIDEPLQLLIKAAEMEPSLITLADIPSTPFWVASIYSLTSDLILRGSIEDLNLALQVAGHLSQQDRLATSIAASDIVEQVLRLLPDARTKEESDLMLSSTRNIPTADAFMITNSAKSDLRRLSEWLEVDDNWNPRIEIVLSATLTLARLEGVSDSWKLFVEVMGVPDDDALIEAGLSEKMPDAMLFAKVNNANQFNKKIKRAKTLPLALRKKLTRPKGR